MRENKAAAGQATLAAFQELLGLATRHLQILDPETGEEELLRLVKSVAAELANLCKMAGKAQPQQLPGGA